MAKKKKGAVKPSAELDQTVSPPREEYDYGTPHTTDDEREEATTTAAQEFKDLSSLREAQSSSPGSPPHATDGCVFGSTWVCNIFSCCLRSVEDTPGVDEARHGG